MILVDANVLVSVVIGKRAPQVMAATVRRGVELMVTEPQIAEAMRVLTEKLGVAPSDAQLSLEAALAAMKTVGPQFYGHMEAEARQRLHDRGQSDWPVLAAALAAGAGVWSHDLDFFGTGVPVWSSRNMRFAT